MSKVSRKSISKKTSAKVSKRVNKTPEKSKSNKVKITVLPMNPDDKPYTKSFINKDNENNLK